MHAAAALDRQLPLGNQPELDGIARHAAQRVAADLGGGAVGIEDRHAQIGAIRAAEEDDPVGPEAEMPIAKGGDLAAGGRGAAGFVGIEVVVPGALHFG